MHHDVFGFTGLNHALDTGQQFVDQLLLGVSHFAVTLDQARFGAVDHFYFAQAVRFRGGTGRDEVANGIRRAARGATSTEPFSRQDLNCTPF